jgi:hypothetical protein
MKDNRGVLDALGRSIAESARYEYWRNKDNCVYTHCSSWLLCATDTEQISEKGRAKRDTVSNKSSRRHIDPSIQ